MALELKTDLNSSTTVSSAGSFLSPLSLTFDGKVGGSKEQKIYILNTGSTQETVNIQVIGVNADHPYKVFLKDSVAVTWTEMLYDNSTSLNNISIEAQSNNYFFMKIEIAPDTQISNFSNLKLRLI